MTSQRTRIQPLTALRAFFRLIRDPEDTTQVGVVLAALRGRGTDPVLERFLRRPDGEEILRRPRTLVDVLTDREQLASLPEGSLGRIYVDYMIREQLSAESLTALTGGLADTESELDRVLEDRITVMHDLFHILTGYGRDLVGEAALLAFTYAQTRSRALGFILATNYALTLLAYLPAFLLPSFLPDPPPGFEDPETLASLRGQLREGYRRGAEAGWLPGADWEALLELPLDEVRRRFAIAPASYQAIRSEGAPEPLAA